MRRMGFGWFFFLFLGVVVTLGIAVQLVHLRYEIRTLFVEHERAVEIGRRLADDQADLLLKIRRAALPSSITEGVKSIGLEDARGENTVNIVMDENHRVPHVDFDIPPQKNNNNNASGAKP